ncbi:uncharacterized protein LOC101451543 isoform X1 [Ceratitis capitata]|uniref:uncharacterized protein LOC101451543 isoform X1 n=1 Tax=Ceratitis capitata TaxID=7213 RepID=UPI00032973FC|nr:uncharacterized protein LOC101451543 isoform X1 [Ceratitis capitata]
MKYSLGSFPSIMCWCLRVYWTVLHNLFTRFVTNFVVSVYNSDLCACLSYSHFTCCVCCDHCSAYKQTQPDDNDHESRDGQTKSTSSFQHHDYVIVDEIDANYLEIGGRKIETENYYRLVDRATAEEILNDGREDGSCLVRPFKETDASIKYVVTVYAQNQFFHLFIRQINGKDFYGIGQQKTHEKRFSSPSEIIDFYSSNTLQCTNKNISVNLVLKPIIT